jgi:hypothetical protein
MTGTTIIHQHADVLGREVVRVGCYRPILRISSQRITKLPTIHKAHNSSVSIPKACTK